MGTRHLIVVKLDNKYKVAQHGQWDGYPSGQGAKVLEFLTNWDRKEFESKLRSSSFLTKDELSAIYIVSRIINVKGLQESWIKCWPELRRATGAEILNIIARSNPGIKLQNNIKFAANSLFCEWAYVIDLDTNMLEVFQGFNQMPLTEEDRFYGIKCDDEIRQNHLDEKGYYPIKKVVSYSLDTLPTVEQMEIDCLTNEEEA